MKKLFKILAAIAIVVGCLFALIVTIRNGIISEDAPSEEQIATMRKQVENLKTMSASINTDAAKEEVAKAEKVLSDIESLSVSKFKTSTMIAYVTMLAGIAALASLFIKGGKLVLPIAGGALVLAIINWLMAANVEPGMLGGANPKTVALTALIALAIGAVLGFLSKKDESEA